MKQVDEVLDFILGDVYRDQLGTFGNRESPALHDAEF